MYYVIYISNMLLQTIDDEWPELAQKLFGDYHVNPVDKLHDNEQGSQFTKNEFEIPFSDSPHL